MADISLFTQSQRHGFFWDDEIRQRVFGLSNACKNDTKKYDIDCSENVFNPNENVSIKVTGSNQIDCGDILRFYHGDFEHQYTIILLRYNQHSNTEKHIREIVEIDYSKQFRDVLFGTVPPETIEEYVRFVKSIPKGRVDKSVVAEYLDRKKDIQRRYGMKINISPKVDSKSQRRVQCSIPQIDDLFAEFPQFVVSRNKIPMVRGVSITGIVLSGKRTFKKIN